MRVRSASQSASARDAMVSGLATNRPYARPSRTEQAPFHTPETASSRGAIRSAAGTYALEPLDVLEVGPHRGLQLLGQGGVLPGQLLGALGDGAQLLRGGGHPSGHRALLGARDEPDRQ